MNISYCITVCDEHEELDLLLNHMLPLLEEEDEIIILRDISKTNSKVSKVILKHTPLFGDRIRTIETSLNKDFAAFKNNFIDAANGEYIFQIDADEAPNEFLIENIKPILNINRDIDVFYIPRVNKVHGITPEHIQRWGWRFDEKERINYPDPQMRLFKTNKGIKWKNKVHEVLDGYETMTTLPWEEHEDFCLYHIKSIKKQEDQNNFYDKI